MADSLRSKVDMTPKTAEEKVLGDKAVGGVDNDADHVPNVESGLKAAISNPNVGTKGTKQAEEKLGMLNQPSS